MSQHGRIRQGVSNDADIITHTHTFKPFLTQKIKTHHTFEMYNLGAFSTSSKSLPEYKNKDDFACNVSAAVLSFPLGETLLCK